MVLKESDEQAQGIIPENPRNGLCDQPCWEHMKCKPIQLEQGKPLIVVYR